MNWSTQFYGIVFENLDDEFHCAVRKLEDQGKGFEVLSSASAASRAGALIGPSSPLYKEASAPSSGACVAGTLAPAGW
jgi:hypothetical protein